VQRSSERILTTHVGSLARPRDLLEAMREKEHARPYDAQGYPGLVARAVADVVAEQVRLRASTSSPTGRWARSAS
jgi:5-methyltetrahydropteroyltriglutamate--homocysteine methyltransferase